jgi:hypothetical protein
MSEYAQTLKDIVNLLKHGRGLSSLDVSLEISGQHPGFPYALKYGYARDFHHDALEAAKGFMSRAGLEHAVHACAEAYSAWRDETEAAQMREAESRMGLASFGISDDPLTPAESADLTLCEAAYTGAPEKPAHPFYVDGVYHKAAKSLTW